MNWDEVTNYQLTFKHSFNNIEAPDPQIHPYTEVYRRNRLLLDENIITLLLRACSTTSVSLDADQHKLHGFITAFTDSRTYTRHLKTDCKTWKGREKEKKAL